MALLSLVAKLGLDKTGFEQGLSKAGKQASQFGSSLKTTLAGAFGATAMIAFAKGISDTVGRIKDLSEQFGVTTDEVQNIDYAMKQSGMSFEDFGAAMNKLGPARREAALGNEELRETFRKFGVSAEDLQDPLLSNKDILIKVAEAMRGTNVTAAEQAAIMDLLGPKAANLANVLAGLDGFQAPSLFSEEDIERIDQIQKELDVFWTDIQVSALESSNSIRGFFEDSFSFLSSYFRRTKDQFQAGMRGEEVKVQDNLEDAIDETAKDIAARDQQREVLIQERRDRRKKEQQEREERAKKLKQLFQPPEKPEKIERPEPLQPLPLRQPDQLGRIGAFSGGPSNNIVGQLKKNTDTLVEIRNVLAVRGIVIKDL